MRYRVIALVVVALAGTLAWWWFHRPIAEQTELVLYGNVEMREVQVAFNDSGRIADVTAEEGDKVAKGDVLARLETSRLAPQLAQAEAQAAAAAAVVDKLRAGSRPEEIAQAEATAAAARADADNARLVYERLSMLSSSGSRSVADSQVDTARATADAADARARAAEEAAKLATAGPRQEDINQATAQLKVSEAAVALVRQQLADAELKAPADGVVRSRLLEPGELASPQRPVLALAIVDPKWVRAYVSEPDLARIRPGMTARVSIDGAAQTLTGQVGFISPVAEFTPHAIQTEELRTSLVYEVRILVSDEGDVLRLGMPTTVRLETGGATALVRSN